MFSNVFIPWQSFVSSLLSPQSSWPLHFKVIGTHLWLEQENSYSPHVLSELKKLIDVLYLKTYSEMLYTRDFPWSSNLLLACLCNFQEFHRFDPYSHQYHYISIAQGCTSYYDRGIDFPGTCNNLEELFITNIYFN